MMAKWTLPIFCLVGIGLLLLPELFAPAQRNEGPQQYGPSQVDWRIASMDRNGDGQVDLVEAQAARPELTADDFKLRDVNGDGVWTREDRRWGFRTLAGRRNLEDIDKNADGKVAMDEYMAACQEEFKVLDADADGGIISDEWPRRFPPGGTGMAGVRPWGPPPEGFDGGRPQGPPPAQSPQP